VTVRLVDADGDSVTKTQAITTGAVQYSLDLPHLAADLQGWTQVGTYDFTTFHHLTVEWTAAGAGEIVYVDGLHEYIGTTTTRGRGETLSGGSAVVLDAQNESTAFTKLGVTDLSVGTYLIIIRAKDTDQVATDGRFYVYNNSDTKHIMEKGVDSQETLTSAFLFYVATFNIASWASGDTLEFKFRKNTVTENTIFVDYFLIIPLGDGRDGPQDSAHAALRTSDNRRRVFRR